MFDFLSLTGVLRYFLRLLGGLELEKEVFGFFKQIFVGVEYGVLISAEGDIALPV